MLLTGLSKRKTMDDNLDHEKKFGESEVVECRHEFTTEESTAVRRKFDLHVSPEVRRWLTCRSCLLSSSRTYLTRSTVITSPMPSPTA